MNINIEVNVNENQRTLCLLALQNFAHKAVFNTHFNRSCLISLCGYFRWVIVIYLFPFVWLLTDCNLIFARIILKFLFYYYSVFELRCWLQATEWIYRFTLFGFRSQLSINWGTPVLATDFNFFKSLWFRKLVFCVIIPILSRHTKHLRLHSTSTSTRMLATAD